MNKFILLALPILFIGTQAEAQACQSDPRATTCQPGYYVDLSDDRGAQCKACTGATVSNGCTRSCGPCPAGQTPNGAHSACVTSPPCPTLSGSQIPANSWSPTSSQSGYYATDSAIINVGNGQVVVGGASRATVKSYMGAAFNGASFTVVGGPGGASNLPYGVISCPYDGPRFKYHGQTLRATVTINCTGTCAGL